MDPDDERIEFVRPAALPGSEVLRAERVARRWRVFHETYAVCAILDSPSTAEWIYRGRVHHTRTGGLMLIEPGETHANTHVTPATSFRALFLDAAAIEQAATEIGLARRHPHLTAANVHDPRVFGAFASLHRSLEAEATDLESQSRLATCVRLLLEGYAERGAPPAPPPGRASLVRARSYIAEHHRENIALADVAAAAGVSRFHLVRAFSREFGLPPHAYHVAVRVERGRALLAGGMPAVDAASAVGFADQSHFTRHFKRIIGVTPGAYARVR